MKDKIKQLMDKFNKLPPAAKIALVAGGGLGLYWLFNADRKNAKSSMEALSDGTVIYPYAVSPGTEYDGGSSGGGGSSSFDTSGLVTIDQFAEWANVTAESIVSLQNQNKFIQSDMLAAPAGVASIPQQGLTLSPDQQLQQAQAAYGAAKTQAEKDAAAAAGQVARAAGATDAGAAAIWQATSTKKATSSPSSPSNTLTANQQLQQAQAAYGAAKTQAEKDAAAAAGQVARAAGASDAGAAEIWQSFKK